MCPSDIPQNLLGVHRILLFNFKDDLKASEVILPFLCNVGVFVLSCCHHTYTVHMESLSDTRTDQYKRQSDFFFTYTVSCFCINWCSE